MYKNCSGLFQRHLGMHNIWKMSRLKPLCVLELSFPTAMEASRSDTFTSRP